MELALNNPPQLPNCYTYVNMASYNMPLNSGMNDGTYRIELTGDEVSWEGRPFHYMERPELEEIWNRMAARRNRLWERRQ